MSWEATSWVLVNSRTQGNAKLILLGLANHAWPDGSHAYPSVDTLAHYANVDRRTAQRKLRSLEEEGHIVRDGVGTEGQTRWRISMGGGNLPPVASEDEGAASRVEGGGTGAARTTREPSKELNKPERARESVSQVPVDFPDELRPHARIVLPVLRSVAEQHRAKAVSALALGRVMMARPRKPLVKAAYDFAAWAADPPRPIRDVVASYRVWLDRESDLAALEPLPGEPSAPNGKVQRKAAEDEAQARRHAARDRLLREAGR